MKHPSEILIVERFAPLRKELLGLLTGLSPDDWPRPTAAPKWSVKDVAAHLLGGDVSILSRSRDDFAPGTPIETYSELVQLIDRLNDEWVTAARRISPGLLCDLLGTLGPKVESYFESLDPMAMGGSVSWAGQEPAPVWFDLAREFTERWHHQQQIRDATGRPPLYDPYFLAPVLQTFVRALPHHFRDTAAPAETSVRFEISGPAGGVWFIRKTEREWLLLNEFSGAAAGRVIIPQDLAWRLFTKGADRELARAQSVIDGDVGLALPIFATTAVIG